MTTFERISFRYVDLVHASLSALGAAIKSLAKGIFKHKTKIGFAFLGAFFTYLLVAEPMSAAAANAADWFTPDKSPLDYANGAKTATLTGACDYLAFCRWWQVSTIPTPTLSVTTLPLLAMSFPLMFSQFFFQISALVMYLIGLGIMLQSWLDPARVLTYQGDYLFAKLTYNLTRPGESPLMFLAISVIVIMFIWYILARLIGNRGKQYAIGKQVGYSFAALILILLVGFQAQANHKEFGRENISSVGKAIDGYYGADTTNHQKEVVNSTPGKWATLSPGWIITSGTWALNQGGRILTEAVGSIGTLLDDTVAPRGNLMQNKNACAAYTEGMHQIYYKTAFGKTDKATTVVAYDDFMKTIYFDNWRLAAMGNSESSANSWCRIAEVNAKKPAGDQIMIARVAGLYKESINVGSFGFLGAEDQAVNHKGEKVQINTNDTENAFVQRDGSWVEGEDSNSGYFRATTVFGPQFPNAGIGDIEKTMLGKDGITAATKAPFVWGICRSYTNDLVSVTPNWGGVPTAESKKGWNDENKNNKLCGEALGFKKWEDKSGGNWAKDFFLGSGWSDKDVQAGFGYHKDASPHFAYYESAGYAGGLLFGMGSSSNFGKLVGSPEALDYYMSVQGLNGSILPMASGLVVLVMLIMFAKTFGGMVFAGFIAGQVAQIALVFSFLLAVALIIPIGKVRKFVAGLFLTIISGLLVAVMIGLVLQTAFQTTNLFSALFAPLLSGNFSLLSGFTVLVVRSLVLLIPLMAWGALIKKFNLSSADGIMSITGATIAPLAQRMGVKDGPASKSPWQSDFAGKFVKDNNPFSRSDEATVATDKNNKGGAASSASSNSGSMFRAGTDAAKKKASDLMRTKGLGALSKVADNKAVQTAAAAHPAARAAVLGLKGAGALNKLKDLRSGMKNATGEEKLSGMGNFLKDTKANGFVSPFTRNSAGEYFNKGKKIDNENVINVLKRLPIPMSDKIKDAGSILSTSMSSFVPDITGRESTKNGLVPPEASTFNINDNGQKIFNGLNPVGLNKDGEEDVFGVNKSKHNVPLNADEVRASMGLFKDQASKGAIVDENITPIERNGIASTLINDKAAGKLFEEQSKNSTGSIKDFKPSLNTSGEEFGPSLAMKFTPLTPFLGPDQLGQTALLNDSKENERIKGFLSDTLNIPVDNLSNNDVKRIMSSISTDGTIKAPEDIVSSSQKMLDPANAVTPQSVAAIDNLAGSFQRASNYGSNLSDETVQKLQSPIKENGEPKSNQQRFDDNLMLQLGAHEMTAGRGDIKSLETISRELIEKKAPAEEIESMNRIVDKVKESGKITAQEFGEIAEISQRSRIALGEQTVNALNLSSPELTERIAKMSVEDRAEMMDILNASATLALGATTGDQIGYAEAVRAAAFEGAFAGRPGYSVPEGLESDMSVVRELIRTNRDLSVSMDQLASSEPQKYQSLMNVVTALNESQGKSDTFITPNSVDREVLYTLRMILTETRNKDMNIDIVNNVHGVDG